MASIYNQLNLQAAMQGYQDVYIELSWMSVCLILLAFMLSKNRPGQGPGASARCTERARAEPSECPCTATLDHWLTFGHYAQVAGARRYRW